MKVGMKVNVRRCSVTHAADDILPLSRQNPTGNRRGAKRCCVRPVGGGGGEGGNFIPSLPRCVCPKVMDMGLGSKEVK